MPYINRYFGSASISSSIRLTFAGAAFLASLLNRRSFFSLLSVVVVESTLKKVDIKRVDTTNRECELIWKKKVSGVAVS